MKKLGCTLCILAFSSFSAEINELKDEKKLRMHIVHPSFFIFELTESAEISELKDEKANAPLPFSPRLRQRGSFKYELEAIRRWVHDALFCLLINA